MALVPKIGAVIALMPALPCSGGVLLFMFGMVATVGVDIIGNNMKTRRATPSLSQRPWRLDLASRPRRRKCV